MMTKEELSLGLPSQLYSVAAIQRNFWKQSSVSIMYVDKASLGIEKTDSLRYFNSELWKPKIEDEDTTWVLNQYNRVLTADLELLSKDNRWNGSFYASRSLRFLFQRWQ